MSGPGCTYPLGAVQIMRPGAQSHASNRLGCQPSASPLRTSDTPSRRHQGRPPCAEPGDCIILYRWMNSAG